MWDLCKIPLFAQFPAYAEASAGKDSEPVLPDSKPTAPVYVKVSSSATATEGESADKPALPLNIEREKKGGESDSLPWNEPKEEVATKNEAKKESQKKSGAPPDNLPFA